MTKRKKNHPRRIFCAVSAGILLFGGVAVYLLTSWTAILSEHLERAYFLTQIIAGLIAVLAGIFVAFQLFQMRRTQEYQQFESTANRIGRIPVLLERQLEFAEASSHVVAEQRSALVFESILDIIDTELLRQREFPESIVPLPPLDDYFSDLFVEYPELLGTLKRRLSWYSTELAELAGLSRQ